MVIEQGKTKNYAESFKEFELAIIDKSDPDRDTVVSIPKSLLAKKQPIQNPGFAFYGEAGGLF